MCGIILPEMSPQMEDPVQVYLYSYQNHAGKVRMRHFDLLGDKSDTRLRLIWVNVACARSPVRVRMHPSRLMFLCALLASSDILSVELYQSLYIAGKILNGSSRGGGVMVLLAR